MPWKITPLSRYLTHSADCAAPVNSTQGNSSSSHSKTHIYGADGITVPVLGSASTSFKIRARRNVGPSKKLGVKISFCHFQKPSFMSEGGASQVTMLMLSPSRGCTMGQLSFNYETRNGASYYPRNLQPPVDRTLRRFGAYMHPRLDSRRLLLPP